jgi:hypothetical protein
LPVISAAAWRGALSAPRRPAPSHRARGRNPGGPLAGRSPPSRCGRSKLLQQGAPDVGREFVARVRHSDLGQSRERRRSQHLLAIHLHFWKPVARRLQREGIAEALLAGVRRQLELHVGMDRLLARAAQSLCVRASSSSSATGVVGGRRKAAGRQHDRHRPASLLGCQLGDALQALAGEQSGEHSGV